MIFICAPDVLVLFSDNFDYQNVHRDFISGILSEEELGYKICIHEAEKAYACRIRNWRTYDTVCRYYLHY